MKLFYKPGSCSLASHIILIEIGEDFTLYSVDLAKRQLKNGKDYLAVNPKGQVPALLLDNGTLLTEGVVILQYLADNSVIDRKLLAPPSSIARYKTLEWLNYIATELHKGFTPLFRHDTPEEYKSIVRGLLEKKLRFVNDALKDNNWIYGNSFTIADAYLFTVLRWVRVVKLNIEGLKHIASYIDRVAARPSVTSALQTEGVIF